MIVMSNFSPMLTWRDLQHIVVMTAKPDYLEDPNWVTNGVGRKSDFCICENKRRRSAVQ